MSKIKVYELAKELDVPSKEVIEFLGGKNIEVKNHMSSLEDADADMARKALTKGNKDAAAKPEAEAPKKKNIVHVFRPQNTQNGAKQGRRPQGQGRPQPNRQTPQQGRPMQVNNGRPAKQQARPAAPAQEPTQQARPQERTADKSFEQARRPAAASQERVQTQERQADRPATDRSQAPRRQERSDDRRQDSRGTSGNRQDRPQGSRPQQGGRPQGNRQDRPQGDRNQSRKPGERPDRRNNDRRSNDAIPAPETPAQKPQRSKVKGKDDHKKKEYRRGEEDGLGKGKKKNEPKQPLQKPQQREQKVEEQIKSIIIPEVLTIQELADKMKIVPSVIVKKLFLQGKIVTVNQEIDYETAEEIALEFDVLCEKEEVIDVIEELLKEEEEDEKKMKKRPPVVCVMGHVDHGKTSLLDAIRHTNVIDREAGGITQHIGAYVVEVNGEKITFLDTPGHEAFTAMRMRGASSTDIAILVVAADDGVMPQTVEAINHAKAAGVEIVVAVNKIDKPSANIDRVKQELTEYELIPEDWGGSTIFVPVSAKTGEGLEDLMEMIVLTAEVMELKANPNRRARGLVLEAELDKGRGSVATVLVQKGTLRVGDSIAAGSAHGKVRAMMDDKGRRVKEAGPSMPVEILGLNDVPNAGEVFVGCANDKEARSFAETF
ncbi:MAG: translation initiation factor IF-2, partial [[Clostridium] scindens]